MSAYWILENVWAFSVQFAAVAALALALARLGRGAVPGARLALLQLGLLAALCAPFLQVGSGPVLPAAMAGVSVETSQAEAPVQAPPRIRPMQLALAALAAGVALRLGWTLLGLAALARRRRRARPIGDACPAFLELRGRLGVEAELLAGPGGPVAFGLFRPAVLIPESLLAAQGEPLEAVLAHELVHLRRRDWLFVLAEELLLAVLWFHPLAWMLIREIRLTREEAVDEQAAEAVSGAAGYLEALLAVARLRLKPAAVPGAEFLRDRQIARRIETLVQQEKPMSRSLQYSLTLTSIVALVCAAWWAGSFSPLQGAPQLADVSPGASEMVSVAQGSEGLILPKQNRPRFARYSYGALISRVEGDVTLELTLDEGGNVVDARAVSGPVELRQEAVRWALDWRYDPSVQSARNVVATVSFRLPSEDPHVTFPLLALPGLLDSADFPPASLVLRSVQSADLDPPNPALQARLESYIGRSLADASLAEAIHSDIVNATEAGASYYATRAYVAPRADGAVLLVRRPSPVERAPTDRLPRVVPTEPPPISKRIRVGGAVQKERLIKQVQPEYPALARQAGIQGSVELSVILTHEGAVQAVEVLSGHPLLIPAAIEAVKQWRYRPTLLNGVPVEVETQVSINFSIAP